MGQQITSDSELRSSLTAAGQGQADTQRDFDDALLAALAGMAARSHRRQADLFVAVRRSGLTATPDLVRAALRHLQDDGCVDRVVPLADGGVLLSVTSRGVERLSHSSLRHMVETI
jgi:hypothetical protein